ncbi:MAG: M6 family metalloprotease domain-containing protein [Nitrospirae bacterium]|nr:M6 family metalloprotease domain-containing protein [Nitrospirota bacterium]
MKRNNVCLSILMAVSIIVFAFPLTGHAVPAAPGIYTLNQPDGSTFRARQWGDESLHGWETEDGYTVEFDEGINCWTFMTIETGGIPRRTSKIVGRDFPPANAPKHIRPSGPARSTAFVDGISKTSSTDTPQPAPATTGTNYIPVLLVNFSNTATGFTTTDFNNLLFSTGNYSMKDYYEEVSYGVFSVSAGPGGVSGWYTASDTHDYYGQNDASGNDMWPGDFVYEAVAEADAAGFNFAPYDQDGDCYADVINIIHQGSGEEAGGPSTDIWSHSWSLNGALYWGQSHYGEYITNDNCAVNPSIKVRVNEYVIQPEVLWGGMQTMGVFAHEYGHALGLPDLYDTDYSSEGIGYWSLMAGGSWNYVTKAGDRPAHMDAWSKYKLGWVSPTLVSGTLTNEPVTQAATAADVYQMLNGTPMSGEYFLVENRQKTGFDAGLPGAGLLIWHIDGGKISNTINFNEVNNAECYPPSNCSSNHYGVALVQADNLYELEKGINGGNTGDPYPGSAGKTSFTDGSSPNSKLYNNSPSNVSITGISSSGPVMTATMSVTPVIIADLTVSSVTAPATAGEGQIISVGDTTKNNGPDVAPASTTKFYWSTNSTWDAGDTYLGSRAVPSLAAGATNSGSTTVTVPTNTCSGTFYIIARADGDNVIAETNETNNNKSKTIKTGADLIISTVTGPTTGGAGQTISVTDTTKNNGGCPAGASTTKYYFSTNSTWDAGDTYLGSRTAPALGAGASSTGSTSVTIPSWATAGTYYIIARADADNVISETSETNNNKSKSIKIGPDLIVSALNAPSSAVRGANITVMDTIKNQGGGSSGASTTTFYLSINTTYDAGDTELGSRSVPALAAGSSNTGSAAITIPSGIATGAYYIIARSDANGVVAETNEANNNRYRAITINP